MLLRRPLRSGDDAGLGMILVIGIVVFVTGLVAVGGTIVMNGLGQTRSRVSFESSLAAAEAGIDLAIGRVQQAYDLYSQDYPIPSPVTSTVTSTLCNAAAIPLDKSKLGTAAKEEKWVRGIMSDLLASHPECVQETPSGQVLVFKPGTPLVKQNYPRSGRIYAMGWAPDRASARSSRLVKVEYVFMPYKPQHALLTGKKLTLKSSVKVEEATGQHPELASVHTNGDLIVDSQGKSLVVTGLVSATLSTSGTSKGFDPLLNPGGEPKIQPASTIPHVSARAFYSKAPTLDPPAMETWYDLCENGDIRPHAGPEGEPCTGLPVLGNADAEEAGSSSFRGWAFQSEKKGAAGPGWYASQDTEKGTYFVVGADVFNGNGTGTFEQLSVISMATDASKCDDKEYGNIDWARYDILAPAFSGLFFMADSDLRVTANIVTGQTTPGGVRSGMYVAGDQIHLQTSSSGLTGAAIGADQCSGAGGNAEDLVSENWVQGQVVSFDPTGDSPFSQQIATTLWLEY